MSAATAGLDLARACVRLGIELPKALITELRGEDFAYDSRTAPAEPTEPEYRFIRQVGNKVSQGEGLGHDLVALEVRVPATLVRDSSMPEETRAALQIAEGELYDQARQTLRARAG